ncbi:MAG TPA: copper resistance protein CopC [Rhizomicrobium sp.]|jgi:hypothetical protein|nr:copper resistance protein CopC [Rhizomicrobium sp.]
MRRAILLIAAAVLFATPALAHAFLQTASPAAGENLRTSPQRVSLHLSEPLEPALSGIAVTSVAGADMSAGPVAVTGGDMVVPLKKLAPGRYRVVWHAVSVDTHRTEGKYNFLVLP